MEKFEYDESSHVLVHTSYKNFYDNHMKVRNYLVILILHCWENFVVLFIYFFVNRVKL